jgi:hypothetical protein
LFCEREEEEEAVGQRHYWLLFLALTASKSLMQVVKVMKKKSFPEYGNGDAQES